MPGRRGPSRDPRKRLCQSRQRALNVSDGAYPLFVCSYSSRGFPDIVERYQSTVHLPPAHLVSLYDLHYFSIDQPVLRTASINHTWRFLDSGTYEILPSYADAEEEQAPPKPDPWSPELYVATARAHARAGDVLVSLDDPELPIKDQIQQGIRYLDEVGTPGVRRDLLLHPYQVTAIELAQLLAEHTSRFDIIGLTEKDIGRPWFMAAAFIQELRIALDQLVEHYIPIHVFGCLDPQTLPYLFFAGADIFDGLAWMRYYFRNGHAFYRKEMEYGVSANVLLDSATMRATLLCNNIAELERIRSDLQYSVSVSDPRLFQDILDVLLTLEKSGL